MTTNFNHAQDVVLVAIDIAKAKNDVLVLLPNVTSNPKLSFAEYNQLGLNFYIVVNSSGFYNP
jgi:hypothetical protein